MVLVFLFQGFENEKFQGFLKQKVLKELIFDDFFSRIIGVSILLLEEIFYGFKGKRWFYGLSFFESVGWKVRIPIRNHVCLMIVELDKAFNRDGRQITLMPREAVPLRAFLSLAIMAPTRLPSKSASKEGVLSYNSQRVMRQLGYRGGS